jgi:hypothetical protein
MVPPSSVAENDIDVPEGDGGTGEGGIGEAGKSGEAGGTGEADCKKADVPVELDRSAVSGKEVLSGDGRDEA